MGLTLIICLLYLFFLNSILLIFLLLIQFTSRSLPPSQPPTPTILPLPS